MKYGIFDTKDLLWIGNDEGPVLYDDTDHKGMALPIARIAAAIADVRLGQAPGRCIAKEWIDQPVHLKDELKTKMETLEALDALEKGLL